MSGEPSDDELRLVLEHSSGRLERALALIELADRRGRLHELESIAYRGTARARAEA